MNALKFAEIMSFVIRAHDAQARANHKRFRKWDGSSPYAIHPIWCAMTILTETSLSEDLRRDGAQALLLHDVLEDTTATLPPVSERVRALVTEMTFKNSQEEMELIWTRSKECLLLKLYDKVSNLLDGSWMDARKRAVYIAYTGRLMSEVERHYGTDLNILRMARAVCA